MASVYPVKITYDPPVDAAYVSFVDVGPGDSVATVNLPPIAGATLVNADIDVNGHLLGIEFIGARHVFAAEVLQGAPLPQPFDPLP